MSGVLYKKNDAGSGCGTIFSRWAFIWGRFSLLGQVCGLFSAAGFLIRQRLGVFGHFRRPFFAAGAYKTADFGRLIRPFWLFAGKEPLLLGPISGRGRIRAGLNRNLYAPATVKAFA